MGAICFYADGIVTHKRTTQYTICITIAIYLHSELEFVHLKHIILPFNFL